MRKHLPAYLPTYLHNPRSDHPTRLHTHPPTYLTTYTPNIQIVGKLNDASAAYVAEVGAIQKTGIDLLHLFDVADTQVGGWVMGWWGGDW